MISERRCKDCQTVFKPTRFAAFRCYDCTIILKKKKVAEYYKKVSDPDNKTTTRILGFKMKNLWFKEKEFAKVCKELKREMDEQYGHDFCVLCERTQSMQWQNHHIIYRSEAPFHKNLHHKKNIIRICCDCHTWIHRAKDNRAKLVTERRLWEIFPEIYSLNAYKEQKTDTLVSTF